VKPYVKARADAPLFVTGTGTDIGKTYVSCALIRALKARGAVVDAFKPVVSGFDPKDAAGSDPARLAAALGATGDVFRIAPRRYRAPLSPNIAARLDWSRAPISARSATC
jgi:dethiobiotin synthetase